MPKKKGETRRELCETGGDNGRIVSLNEALAQNACTLANGQNLPTTISEMEELKQAQYEEHKRSGSLAHCGKVGWGKVRILSDLKVSLFIPISDH